MPPKSQKQISVIKDRWRLDGKIGEGGFGSVYLATDLETNEIVAVKLQALPPNSEPSQIDALESESLYYSLLRAHPGIAALHANGRQDSHEYMVFELLGASLQTLFHHCGGQFSLKTTLMLADQLIERLEAFHSRNLLHRDVKPDNFAMGFGKENGKTAYILDFGLVGNYVNDDKFVSAPSYAFCGTYIWASIAAHLDRSQSPKDDLESLAYMLIYFARGFLPWQMYALDDQPTNVMRERITRLKLSLPIELICKDLPSAFCRHLKYVRSLTYNDKPDYAGLRAMYQRLMRRMGYEYDGVFDWDFTESRNNGVQQQVDKEQPQDKNLDEGIKEQEEEGKIPAKKPKGRVIKIKAGNKQEEAQQQPKAPLKRRIVFIKKAPAVNEAAPLKRQRSKPAPAAKNNKAKKVVAKKTTANKIVLKKAPPRKTLIKIKAS